ncbi:tetratricopeptide repeat protein [Phytohabitans sp. ZYX-F-186]|uniref:Tetratricopeptide repeat protein n=1 Tax=Phytohabitans maris TaxID=3071409 RepID=A0ABU0ZKS4_9ACTN|nr:tetratricopeptide repeat protein [Phytohabitans sp. ZYX-F-186]MDQ7907648.1 tetratricopeptide repeat protein [Phytohabitans sp. ZYX-F-186]
MRGSDRHVEHVHDSVVVTGDGNVVLFVSGREFARVPIPRSGDGVEQLLFGRHRSRGSAVFGSWLRPDAGVLEPQPRPELAELAAWCADDQAPVVRLVCGAGGQGKTFLAARLCERVRGEGWLAGFVTMPPANWRALSSPDTAGVALRRELLRLPELTAGIHAAVATGTRTLLVVDYAENVAPVVAELLNAVADVDGFASVRMLLLARSADTWWDELTVEHRHYRSVQSEPVKLESLTRSLTPSQVGDIWHRAVETFTQRAAERGLKPSPAERTSGPPATLSTTLDLYAGALLQVIDPIGGTAARGGDALARVLEHERRQVAHAFRAQQVELSPLRRDWAMLTAALRPAATLKEAARALGSVPALHGLDDAALLGVAEVLHRLYPHDVGTDVWQAPQPDPLVDVHLRQMATNAPSDTEFVEALAALCGGGELGPAMHAAKVLHRCWSSLEPDGRFAVAHRRIGGALRTLVRRSSGGYAPALTALDPNAFAAEIVAAVEGESAAGPSLSVAEVTQLDQMLRSMESTYTRGAIAVAVSRRLVAATRCGEHDTPIERSRHAEELGVLSLRLAEIGEARESLERIQEAVAIRRTLAANDPRRYRAALADSLSDLSTRLDRVGIRDHGLLAAEEAVELYRAAVADDRRYWPYLADKLNALSNCLRAVDRDRSLAASEESVEICRRLADADDAARADLAMALNNHSLKLGGFQLVAESMKAIREATDIYRALAERNPAAHSRMLSRALHNLALRLRDSDEPGTSLDAFDEAVAMRRRLTGSRSTRVARAELAASLAARATVLRLLGRRDEGIDSAREAIHLYRSVVEPNSPAYQPNFAAALVVLARNLARTDDKGEALGALQEALAIRMQQVEQGDVGALPELVDVLGHLAGVAQAGDGRPDLWAVHNAVSVVREGAKAGSTAHLARALDYLSRIMAAAHQRQESVAAAEEAADLWETLAAAEPGRYRSDFRASIHALVARLIRFDLPVDILGMAGRLKHIPNVGGADDESPSPVGLVPAPA